MRSSAQKRVIYSFEGVLEWHQVSGIHPGTCAVTFCPFITVFFLPFCTPSVQNIYRSKHSDTNFMATDSWCYIGSVSYYMRFGVLVALLRLL